ncbi:hypothetical protein D3C85_1459530 [compost metagenome]
MKSGTNSPHPIQFEGQLSVFESPHSGNVLLVDRAEYNRYSRLVWVALLPEDPVALEAIALHRATKP